MSDTASPTEMRAEFMLSRIARRDAAKNRYQSKMSEEAIQLQERANARREKEKVGSLLDAS